MPVRPSALDPREALHPGDPPHADNTLHPGNASRPGNLRGGRAGEFPFALLILAIVIGGAALRLYGLDRTSLWNDEAACWSIASQPFWTMLRLTAADNHPPLYNTILFATIRLLGDSETAMRLPSAIMGIANIYLIYRLGQALWDRLTGVFAAALLAFAGFHIWYSQEVRMYALLCLTATGFALATVLFLNRPGRLRAAICGAAGLLLLYSHIYGALNWGAINLAAGLVLLAARRDATEGSTSAAAKAWLVAQGVAIVAFVPWIVVLVGLAGKVMNAFWIPFPTIQFLYWTVTAITGGTAMLGCLLLLVLIALLRAPDVGLPVRTPGGVLPGGVLDVWWRRLLLLAWGLLPMLGGYAISLTGRPILYDRYLIGSLPPLLLLAARGLWTLRSFHRLVLPAAIAVLVACAIPPVYRSVATAEREDFRAAVASFATRYAGADAVIFSSPGVANAFHYYFHKPAGFEVSISHPETDPVDWPAAKHVWVFARDGIAGDIAPLLQRVGALYPRQQVWHFYGVTLLLYGPMSAARGPAEAAGAGAQAAP